MNLTRPHSAAEAASVERLGALLEDTINQRKPAEDLHGSDDISLQPKPGEDLDIIPRVSRLDGGNSVADVLASNTQENPASRKRLTLPTIKARNQELSEKADDERCRCRDWLQIKNR